MRKDMEKTKKSETIRFRAKEDERLLFQRAAEENNMTLSDFIRRSVRHQIKSGLSVLQERD